MKTATCPAGREQSEDDPWRCRHLRAPAPPSRRDESIVSTVGERDPGNTEAGREAAAVSAFRIVSVPVFRSRRPSGAEADRERCPRAGTATGSPRRFSAARPLPGRRRPRTAARRAAGYRRSIGQIDRHSSLLGCRRSLPAMTYLSTICARLPGSSRPRSSLRDLPSTNEPQVGGKPLSRRTS